MAQTVDLFLRPKHSMHKDISLASRVLSESVLPKPSQSLGQGIVKAFNQQLQGEPSIIHKYIYMILHEHTQRP